MSRLPCVRVSGGGFEGDGAVSPSGGRPAVFNNRCNEATIDCCCQGKVVCINRMLDSCGGRRWVVVLEGSHGLQAMAEGGTGPQSRGDEDRLRELLLARTLLLRRCG